MVNLGCLWNRSRLEGYADAALSPRAARSVDAHLHGCDRCRGYVEREQRLKSLIHAAVAEPVDPDWTSFWPGIKAGIARETPRPIRDPWWIPLWRPFWGHPRLALGGAVAAMLALALSMWPGSEGTLPAAWAAPVVVQDVGTPDPNRTVMVYSTPDSTAERGLTVIWLLNSDGTTDES